MVKSLAIISAGAVLGAIIRWGAGIVCHGLHPVIPMGTLLVNIAGGYCMGLFLGIGTLLPNLAPEWRLLIVTGFLGSLTTFSSFSGEVGILLQQNRFFWAMGLITMHVVGSLFALFLGVGTVKIVAHYGQMLMK